MTIMVDLPAQVEARVQAEAVRQQKSVAAVVADLVSRALPDEEETGRRERALALLRSVGDIGSVEEQQETFTYLQTAVDEDRLSDRKCFA